MPPTLIHGSQQWPLERGTITIGRQDTCDIVISDRSLSRAHATMEISRDGIELHDNNSSNGTFVNNVRIATTFLKHGDQVRFGNMECSINWPESVVQVSASPISAADAQKIRAKLATKAENTTDWKASLATTAAFGAIGTGVVSGILGAIMGNEAILVAVMVGAIGGIVTTLAVKNVTEQKVGATLSKLKDDLDLYMSGQEADIPIPKGFPELVEVVHTIRLGTEIVKDRAAGSWRMRLHEAQVALEAMREMQSTAGVDRGFTEPLLALDGQFRIQGWNPQAKTLFKPGMERIPGTHLLEAMHNMELGSHLIGVLNGLQPGQAQVLPNIMANQVGIPLSIVAAHAHGAPGSHQYLLLFVSPQA